MNTHQGIERVINQKQLFHESVGNVNKILNLRVVVLAEPKTGTSTLFHSILRHYGTGSAIHMHADHTCLWPAFPVLKNNSIGINDLIKYRNVHNHNKVILTYGYRTPIERLLSLYFHCNKKTIRKSGEPDHTHNIMEFFKSISHYYYKRVNRSILDAYNFYKKQWDIDILELEFDKEQGTQVTEFPEFTLVQYRLDKMENIKPILEELLCTSGLELPREYVSNQNIYKQIKNNFKPTKEFLDETFRYYDKYMHHFQTNEEIEQYKNYWYNRVS